MVILDHQHAGTIGHGVGTLANLLSDLSQVNVGAGWSATLQSSPRRFGRGVRLGEFSAESGYAIGVRPMREYRPEAARLAQSFLHLGTGELSHKRA
jgi:hypothetical protein